MHAAKIPNKLRTSTSRGKIILGVWYRFQCFAFQVPKGDYVRITEINIMYIYQTVFQN